MSKKRKITTKVMGILFMVPITVFLVYSVIIPFIWNIILSFQKWDGMGKAQFVGISNYLDAFQDELVFKSILNSVIFALGSTVGAVVLGLFLATLVFRIVDRSDRKSVV